MRMLTFAGRNAKEILRDPLTVLFGLGFPLILLLLLSAIQANIPVNLFEIQSLAPGITVFGLSFITLFSATVLAKDRGSSLLQRLYTTPLTPADFILGYTLPILPMALSQTALCYAVALLLGLDFTVNILLAILLNLPVSLLFISLGLLFGSILNEKQVGGVFQKIAHALPFYHAVELARAVTAGDYACILPHLWWVAGYAIACTVAAILLFLRQMGRQ